MFTVSVRRTYCSDDCKNIGIRKMLMVRFLVWLYFIQFR